MLLEFKCSNHKSIKNEIRFSMIAGSDTASEEFLKEYSNFKILRSAVIYGANGSGKSNFINALLFVKELVGNSINHQLKNHTSYIRVSRLVSIVFSL